MSNLKTPLLFCALFCALFALSASASTYYWNVADGDWSLGSNWNPAGPPTINDYAYVDNGGTARITANAYTTLLIIAEGTVIQDGGDLTLFGGEFPYNRLSIGTNGSISSDGAVCTYHEGTYGEYNIYSGELGGYMSWMTIAHGRFNQYGGTVDIETYIRMQSTESTTEYNLYEGNLRASLQMLGDTNPYDRYEYHPGTFSQNGGSCDLGSVSIDEGGVYNLNGGSLQISYIHHIFGRFNLGSDGFSLEVENGVLDLSQSLIGDVSASSFQGGAASLLILSAGFDPYTQFGSFATDGLVHYAGGTLTIAAGYTIEGGLKTDDHVVIEGQLDAQDLCLLNGLEVAAGGEITGYDNTMHVYGHAVIEGTVSSEEVYLHDGFTVSNSGVLGAGELYVSGGVSNLDDGEVNAMLYLQSTTGAVFNQTGGTLEGKLLIGSTYGLNGPADVVNISGGTADIDVLVGYKGLGRVNQTGGEITFGFIYVGSLGNATSDGEYTISAGTLSGDKIEVRSMESSRFVQTGGDVTTNILTIGNGLFANDTRYVYAGGSLAIIEELSVNRDGVLELQADWASTVDTLALSGGTLQIAAGKALSIGSLKGIAVSEIGTINGAVDFLGEDGSIFVAAHGTLDLSQAQILNAAAAGLASEADTLIVVPVGYDIASVFGTADIGGTVMEARATFVVEAGQDLTFNFMLPMAVEVYGTLRSGSSYLGGTDGLTVKNGGVLDVGDNGIGVGIGGQYSGKGYSDYVILEDGGRITAGNICVAGKGTAGATMWQHGGVVETDVLYIGGDNAYVKYLYNSNYYMDGGTLAVTEDIFIARAGTAQFYVSDGEINTRDLTIGATEYDVFLTVLDSHGEFVQTGGAVNLTGSLHVASYYHFGYTEASGGDYINHNNTAEYRLEGGQLVVAGDLEISISDPHLPGLCSYSDPEYSSVFRILGGHAYISGDITVWSSGIFDDNGSTGGVIELLGNLQNNSYMREDFDMRHTTLILHGGTEWNGETEDWDYRTIDMNSTDFGATVAGLDYNFALGDLVFSGNATETIHYRLESDIYCYGLSIEAGASIDLNGYNVYYMPQGCGAYSGISGSTLCLEGNWFGGEVIAIADAPPVPEPGTIMLLGAGVLGLAGVIRKRMA